MFNENRLFELNQLCQRRIYLKIENQPNDRSKRDKSFKLKILDIRLNVIFVNVTFFPDTPSKGSKLARNIFSVYLKKKKNQEI